MPRDVSLSDSKCWNGGQKWVNVNQVIIMNAHFLFEHGPVKGVVVLVVQGSEQDAEQLQYFKQIYNLHRSMMNYNKIIIYILPQRLCRCNTRT